MSYSERNVTMATTITIGPLQLLFVLVLCLLTGWYLGQQGSAVIWPNRQRSLSERQIVNTDATLSGENLVPKSSSSSSSTIEVSDTGEMTSIVKNSIDHLSIDVAPVNATAWCSTKGIETILSLSDSGSNQFVKDYNKEYNIQCSKDINMCWSRFRGGRLMVSQTSATTLFVDVYLDCLTDTDISGHWIPRLQNLLQAHSPNREGFQLRYAYKPRGFQRKSVKPSIPFRQPRAIGASTIIEAIVGPALAIRNIHNVSVVGSTAHVLTTEVRKLAVIPVVDHYDSFEDIQSRYDLVIAWQQSIAEPSLAVKQLTDSGILVMIMESDVSIDWSASFATIHRYEEAGVSLLLASRVPLPDWTANEAVWSVLLRKAPPHPYKVLDASTMLHYQYPSRREEQVYCAPTNKRNCRLPLDPVIPNIPLSDFTMVQGKRKAISRIAGIPMDAFVGIESLNYGILWESRTESVIDQMYNNPACQSGIRSIYRYHYHHRMALGPTLLDFIPRHAECQLRKTKVSKQSIDNPLYARRYYTLTFAALSYARRSRPERRLVVE